MITIKDIAKKSGVSVSTVSRVINNRPDVSEEAREKVLAVTKQFNYIPNGSARDLAGTKTDAIGLIMRGMGNPFFSEVYSTMEQTIQQSKYSLVIHQISSTDDEIKAGAELARAKRLCGLIFMGGNFAYSRKDIEILDVPAVFCTYNNKFGELPKSDYSSVSIDDEEAAYNAVKELIKHGHKKIAVLLAATDDQSISELRYKGYCKALSEHNIEVNENYIQKVDNFSLKAAYRATEELLQKNQEFTAVFAISDTLAMAAMKALANHGKKIPEDVSVIGIDGLEMSEFSIPTLTTMMQPKEELAEKTIKVLLNLIEGDQKNSQVSLHTSFRPGNSIRRIEKD